MHLHLGDVLCWSGHVRLHSGCVDLSGGGTLLEALLRNYGVWGLKNSDSCLWGITFCSRNRSRVGGV